MNKKTDEENNQRSAKYVFSAALVAFFICFIYSFIHFLQKTYLALRWLPSSSVLFIHL